ncbi:MAG: hypothetical protein ACOCV4_06745 [Myxococcota bacterium]
MGCERGEPRPEGAAPAPAAVEGTPERAERREADPERAVPEQDEPARTGAAPGGGELDAAPSGRGAAPLAAPRRVVGSDVAPDRLLDRLQTSAVRSVEPIGRTSMVFRLFFEDGTRGSFEPATRQHPRGHRAEVAAYRVSRLLGLDVVPPVITRRFSLTELRARLDPDFRDVWDEIERSMAPEADGFVPGAVIHWVSGARPLGLEREGARRQWGRWLSRRGTVPADRRALARDLSNMVAFDYLVGNTGRLGEGLAAALGTPDGRRLFLRDHRRSFASPLPPVLHRKLADSLVGVERFSRRFVERLSKLAAGAIRAELARDPGHASGAPLLTDAQIAAMMDRREALLSHVGALIDARGADRVLVFR